MPSNILRLAIGFTVLPIAAACQSGEVAGGSTELDREAAELSSLAELPVTKDASLIGSSYAVGGNGSNNNYGARSTVDVGSYHHQSRAILGYGFQGLDASTP